MKNQADIKNFIGFFKRQITAISRVRRILYKKLLFACLLDTIGKARFPKGGNRNRIVSFMSACSNSPEIDRVSLIHLSFHLDCVLRKGQKAHSKLYLFAKQENAKLAKGRIYRGCDVDPFFDYIKGEAKQNEERALKFARYDELFFEYRHKLVHEFREPGYGIEMSQDGSSPYYHSYINRPWQLVFPVGFFKRLVKDCLAGLEKYLLENDINPYENDIYEFGDMWIPKDTLIKKKPKKK